jgi:hypothetical protein
LVTVNVYVPATIPVAVFVVPDPLTVWFTGRSVSSQFHDDGSPLKATLPVDTAQVGCVIVPITGGVGVAGWALIITFDDPAEIHP